MSILFETQRKPQARRRLNEEKNICGKLKSKLTHLKCKEQDCQIIFMACTEHIKNNLDELEKRKSWIEKKCHPPDSV